MAAAVLFDVNETTLDLAPLGPVFASVFGDASAARVWFPRLLHTSAVCAMTEAPSTFRDLAAEELRQLAATLGVSLSPEDEQAVLGAFEGLPAHADVEPTLARLASAGIATFAFSNSSTTLLERQLTQAGLIDRFDGVISVEEAKSFKPDRRVYAHALSRVALPAESVWMLAAHDWDVHGAMKAGLRGALLERSPGGRRSAYLEPDARSSDMVQLVGSIIDWA